LCAAALDNSYEKYIFKLSPSSEVSFYTTERPQNFEGTCIQNGEGYILITSGLNAEKYMDTLKNCFGFSVVLRDKNLLPDILKKVKVVKTEIIEGREILYAQTTSLPFSTFVENKKVNIQIAICSSNFIVGCPLILGSY
jgi:hypothetical protein